MKKIFLVLSMMFISVNIYGVETSIGLSSPGFGLGFLRGSDAKKIIGDLKKSPSSGISGFEKVLGLSLSPAVQLNLMIEFLPFIAIETGVGWRTSTIAYKQEASDTRIELTFRRNEIIVPIMLRFQHEFKRIVVYGSAGVLLGIPLSQTYEFRHVFLSDKLSNPFSNTNDYNASTFNMDVSFALGGEVRVGRANYIGLRVGYDLNVLSPLDAEETAAEKGEPKDDFESWYHDNFNVSLSYRYAFNSKWNK